VYNVHKIQIMDALAQFFICAIADWLRNKSVIIIAHVHTVFTIYARVMHTRSTHSNFHENARKTKIAFARERKMEKALSRCIVKSVYAIARRSASRTSTYGQCARNKYNLFYSNSSDKFLENCV